MSNSRKSKLKVYLESLSKSDLIELILDLCSSSEQLKNEITRRLEKSHGTPFAALKRKLEHTVTDASEYGGYLSYHGSEDVCVVLDEILEASIATAKEGDISLALDMALYVLRKFEEFSQFSCEMCYDPENVTSVLTDIIALSSQQEHKMIAEKLLTYISGVGRDSDYNEYVLDAASDAASKENKDVFLDYVDRYASGYFHDSIVRKIIAKADGEAAAHQYTLDHLDNDSFRREIIDEALESQQFDRAVQLCKERIAMTSSPNQRLYSTEWDHLLHDIYQAAGDIRNLTEQTRHLVELGDTKYYDEAKELLTAANEWDGAYPALLEQIRKHVHANEYMRILAKESEAELLLEEVKRNPQAVFQYGSVLFPHYPHDVSEIAHAQIERKSAVSSSRSVYQEIGADLELMAEWGDKEHAIAVLNSLLDRYRRRRAMQEELRKSRDIITARLNDA